MIRTALYVRCSSIDQVRHGVSIPDQLARLRAEAQAAGETVAATFIDQARSGTSAAKRPAYHAMLAAARRGEFNRVRVESVDRGHRNDLERRQFEAELMALGITISYSGEHEGGAPEFRKFNRGLRGVVAELESDVTSQRTYKRHLHRAQQGKWRGGNIPYGLRPDAAGWFEQDPESYAVLLWLLERRAEGVGYHSIAKRLNQGIGEPPAVPPTPGVLAYARRPYLERQDPETGDILHLPRRAPDPLWKPIAVRRICEAAADGIYAGVYQWGRSRNRFDADAEGRAKAPVRVEGLPALVPAELLARVRAVELAAAEYGARDMAAVNSYLLELTCSCGQAIHGYTSTKYKVVQGEQRAYRYRKYRCAGRVNKPGACRMPMLAAEMVEREVVAALFQEARLGSPDALRQRVTAAMEGQRAKLRAAIGVLDGQIADQAEQRRAALAAVADPSLSPLLKRAMITHAEEQVRAVEALEVQRRTLEAGLEALELRARSVQGLIDNPDLDPSRFGEPAANQALKRLIRLVVKRATLVRCGPREFMVELAISDFSPDIRGNGSGESSDVLWHTNRMLARRAPALGE